MMDISINGESFEIIEIDQKAWPRKGIDINLNPVLKKINEMQDKGWELYQNGCPGAFYIFYMRKKKQ
jgi:hypothetical protein